VIHLQTDRLILRDWAPRDLSPFADMNADPRVMEFFPKTCSREQSDDLVLGTKKSFAESGFGLFALEVRETKDFIGFTGFSSPEFKAFFTPAIEIGWRLKFSAWGQGYAREAASACLSLGFSDLGFEGIVSFTSASNHRSIAVMEKIGMTKEQSFDHPSITKGHPLRPHVLYRAKPNK